MPLARYYLVRRAYAAWQAGDLLAFGGYLAEDVTFSVPASSRPYVGTDRGRATLVERLEAFLEVYDVVEFGIDNTLLLEDCVDCRVSYAYKSRACGLIIHGKQRHIWRVEGGQITSFDIAHDAQRLAAFFSLSEGRGAALY